MTKPVSSESVASSVSTGDDSRKSPSPGLEASSSSSKDVGALRWVANVRPNQHRWVDFASVQTTVKVPEDLDCLQCHLEVDLPTEDKEKDDPEMSNGAVLLCRQWYLLISTHIWF